jgi:hypothetical protein
MRSCRQQRNTQDLALPERARMGDKHSPARALPPARRDAPVQLSLSEEIERGCGIYHAVRCFQQFIERHLFSVTGGYAGVSDEFAACG